jgi:hypothetical protein
LLPAKQRNCLLFLTLRPKPYPNRTGWPMSKAYCVMQREASDVQPTCLEWQWWSKWSLHLGAGPGALFLVSNLRLCAWCWCLTMKGKSHP